MSEETNQLSLLNRVIAELLGYHPQRNIAGGIDIVGNNFLWGNCLTAAEAWRDALTQLPDWSSDVGAAFLLCSDIGTQHDYELVTFTSHGITTATFQNAFTDEYVIHADATTPALAMARLALRVLNQKD